jgi:hypothetical protein
MSSAGTIFKEQVLKPVEESAAGTRSIYFTIENDGFIITIQQTTGGSPITAKLYSELPGIMGDIFLGEFVSSTMVSPQQLATLGSHRIRLDLEWTTATTINASVKPVSAKYIEVTNATGVISATAAAAQLARTQTLAMLDKICESNEAIRNHLREITAIENDQGDIF